MFPVFVFLGVAWLLGGIWLVIALIYIIIFFMVPTPAKVIMILIVALAECVNVVEGKYEPGKGEFIEINRQIEARQKELRKKGYSYRKINEDTMTKIDYFFQPRLDGMRLIIHCLIPSGNLTQRLKHKIRIRALKIFLLACLHHISLIHSRTIR